MSILGLTPSSALALIDAASGDRLTYGELVERGEAFGAAMGASKSMLLLLCRNDAFTATAYAGCLLTGHAVALLDVRQTAASTASLQAVYRAPWIAGPPGTATRLVEAGVAVESASPMLGGELIRVADVSPPTIHPDLQVLLCTSGTTGSQKYVRLSAANIDANAASISAYLELTPDERPAASLPIHYSFGLSVVDSHWRAGAAPLLTTESLVQGSFWRQFREHACTSLSAVPYGYQILEKINFREMELSSLTSMQQAGGALDLRLTSTYADHMAARGGRFFVMYGQTEATARMAYVPPAMLAEKAGSAGRAIPGGRLRIDMNRPDPARPHVGEVIYEGPNVMLGYANTAEDLAQGDVLGGVLRTGDLGSLDDDGFLFLMGRSKRIAKIHGLRLNLDEIERDLQVHGAAAVVGGDDALWVYCAFGTAASVNELGDDLARRYRISRQAMRVHWVERIPTATSGKINYQEVERWTSADAATTTRTEQDDD